MSGALPNTNFISVNLSSNQKTLFSETDSGKTFRRQIQGQRLKAGDFIKFAHSKVYMVVEDATSSSNASTVTIEPPLREALANDSSVTYDAVPFTVYLVSDVQEFATTQNDGDGNLLFSYEFDVIESL